MSSSNVESLRRRAITSAGFGHIAPRPPPRTSPAYDLNLATLASKVLYRSGPDPSGSGGPLLILCAAAFPDTRYVDYNKLLPYVLSELPADEELTGGVGYSVVFFAGGGGEKPGGDTQGPLSPGAKEGDGANSAGKWHRPAWSWSLQAYNLLSRAVRKNIRKLWIVHERAWVRILFEAAQAVVSPKFKKKVVHVASLSELATHLPLQMLNIPPQVYLHDRKINPTITIPNSPPPVFGVQPFPPGEFEPALPLVLIESSRCIRSNHLKTEGLFRVTASMQLLEIVREAYDRGQYLRCYDYGPHIAAGLVKLYYRSLPEPIIHRRFYPALAERVKAPGGIKNLLTCSESKGGLPFTSRILLTRHLIPLLAQVAANQKYNKMTPENLAICVAPSLVRTEDPLMDVTMSRGPVSQILIWGIENVDELAPSVPVRPGKKEMNSKKVPLGQLVNIDDDGDGGGGGEKGDGSKEQQLEGEGGDAPSLPRRAPAVKRAEGSPLSPKFQSAPWTESFGGPLPSSSSQPQPQAQQAQRPVPPIPPIHGIPLSLQPAIVQNVEDPQKQRSPLLIPELDGPLQSQPQPQPQPQQQNLPPTIPPKPAAFSSSPIAITTDTPSIPPTMNTSVGETSDAPKIPTDTSMVNTRSPPAYSTLTSSSPSAPPSSSAPPPPSASSPYLNAKIDSSAVAASVAKFQALAAAAAAAAAASATPGGMGVGRRASSSVMVSGETGMGGKEEMVERGGTRTWRTHTARHLQLPLPLQGRELPGLGEVGTRVTEGTGAGVKGVGGRGLHKARSEIELGGGRRGVGIGELGGAGGMGNVAVRKASFDTRSGVGVDHVRADAESSSAGISPSRSQTWTAQIARASTLTSAAQPRIPRKAKSTVDFHTHSQCPAPAQAASASLSSSSTWPAPGTTTAPARKVIKSKPSLVEELRRVYEEKARGAAVLAEVEVGKRSLGGRARGNTGKGLADI